MVSHLSPAFSFHLSHTGTGNNTSQHEFASRACYAVLSCMEESCASIAPNSMSRASNEGLQFYFEFLCNTSTFAFGDMVGCLKVDIVESNVYPRSELLQLNLARACLLASITSVVSWIISSFSRKNSSDTETKLNTLMPQLQQLWNDQEQGPPVL
jgi:hypothetical protein